MSRKIKINNDTTISASSIMYDSIPTSVEDVFYHQNIYYNANTDINNLQNRINAISYKINRLYNLGIRNGFFSIRYAQGYYYLYHFVSVVNYVGVIEYDHGFDHINFFTSTNGGEFILVRTI